MSTTSVNISTLNNLYQVLGEVQDYISDNISDMDEHPPIDSEDAEGCDCIHCVFFEELTRIQLVLRKQNGEDLGLKKSPNKDTGVNDSEGLGKLNLRLF